MHKLQIELNHLQLSKSWFMSKIRCAHYISPQHIAHINEMLNEMFYTFCFYIFLLLWIINIFRKKFINNKLHVHPAKIPEPLAYRSFQFDILITEHYKKGYLYHLIFLNFQQMLPTPIYVCMYVQIHKI